MVKDLIHKYLRTKIGYCFGYKDYNELVSLIDELLDHYKTSDNGSE